MSDKDNLEVRRNLVAVADFLTGSGKLLKDHSAKHTPTMLIGGNLYQLATEHCNAIVLMLQYNLDSSAMAMIRPAREAFLRGSWSHYCAEPETLVEITKQKEFPKTKSLLRAIEESAPRYVYELIKHIESMLPHEVTNGLTHCGMEQVLHRISNKKIRADFGKNNLIAMLQTAAAISLGALTGMAKIADRNDTRIKILEKYHLLIQRTYQKADLLPDPSSIFANIRSE